MAKVILDTGPLVALIDEDDEYHHWATERVHELKAPLLTCDAVLTETCFLLRSHPVAFRYLETFLTKKLIISSVASDLSVHHVFNLMATYRNVPMSFADACLVCMIENHPGSTLFTLDSDFTIYRQQRHRLIPLIAPF